MHNQTNRQPSSLLAPTVYVAGGLYLIGLWLRNYNLLGNLYDYSIVASAAGHLHAGLLPYRDFTTPLQSLTIYVAAAAEWMFGPSYLSLAYANLILGLAFYAAILWCLRDCLPLLLRLLAAIALCSATVFQHGIVWYNTIAIVLLILIAWRGALWYREGHRNRHHAAVLCVLLFLSSMTKLNFHVLGLGVTAGLLLLIFLKLPATERKGFVWIIPAILISGVLLGPAVEVLLNRTTFHDFWQNVVATPQSRFLRLLGFLNPNLYLGKAADTYPDNWSSGVFLKAALIYGGCLWFFLRRTNGTTEPPRPPGETLLARRFMPILLLGFYAGSLMLSMSNIETQMLTSAFLLAGLAGVFVMFAPLMSDTQSAGFKFGIFLLSGFFAVTGGASAFMHSRVRYGEPSWTDAMLQTLKERRISALQNAVPFYPATEINPHLETYFHGVRFTEPTCRKLQRVFSMLDRNHLHEQADRIYWGPGLEMLGRVYGSIPKARLPLWYHYNVTVRDSDSPRIIAALQTCDFEWIIGSAYFMHEMPPQVRAYIDEHYDVYDPVEGEDIKFLRKKSLSLNAASATPERSPVASH